MTVGLDYIKIEIVYQNSNSVLASSDFNIEGNRIILHGEEFPILDRGSTVKAIGQSRKGITVMEGVVTLSIEKQLNIDIKHFGEIKERREYLKVRTDVKAIIQKAFMGKSKRGLIVDKEIQLRDISIGGISFLTNEAYFINQRLYICLNDLDENLIVRAIVLRKQKEIHSFGYRYRYACKFIKLDNFGQRVICEHVFKKELENHREEEEKNKKIYD